MHAAIEATTTQINHILTHQPPSLREHLVGNLLIGSITAERVLYPTLLLPVQEMILDDDAIEEDIKDPFLQIVELLIQLAETKPQEHEVVRRELEDYFRHLIVAFQASLRSSK